MALPEAVSNTAVASPQFDDIKSAYGGYRVGGMLNDQSVTDRVSVHPLKSC